MSKYDSLSNALDTYLTCGKTPYAVMISGYWGVGKTYYLLNSLIPAHENFEFHYLSLYGLKSAAEIRKQIDQKLSSNPGSPVRKQVVCLDDLERWQADLDYCMSYVNELVEHRHCKCILVGNLQELTAEGLKSFNRAQEKTVRHVYQYKPSMSEILDIALSLVDYTSAASRRFIRSVVKSNADPLNRMLDSVSMRNIRVLAEAIQMYDVIYRHHASDLKASKGLAFTYFMSLVSIIILVKRSFLEANETRKLLESEHESNKGFKFLSEVGYFDKDLSVGLTEESRILLDTIFFRLDKISLRGLFSIVRNGYYLKDDFKREFEKWVDEQDYERYLDREYFYNLDNATALDIFNRAIDTFITRREVTNPVTLLLLAERVVEDIANGAVDYDPVLFKKQIMETVDELYDSGRMDMVEIKLIDLASDRFRNCIGIYNCIIRRNRERLWQVSRNEIASFWCRLLGNPESIDILMAKYSPISVLSESGDPLEQLTAMASLDNARLNRLVNWIEDGLDSPDFTTNANSLANMTALSRLLVRTYGQSVGIKESHFRRLAQILNTSSFIEKAG